MIKMKVKDSLFTHMFGDESKEYLLQLYRALHPEDIATDESGLDIISIENVFTNDIYNDLGFIVNGKLITLVEAQSTWSSNIIFRLFLYLAKSYQNYVYSDKMLKAKLYGGEALILPKAELYVIYAGTKGRKSTKLSLKEEFFDDESAIDVKANVIYADDERDDIIGEYLAFCTILKEQLRVYNKDKEAAVRATIKICIEQGKLSKYLSEHRKEVEEYMLAIMSSEEAYESYGDYRELLGEEKGVEKGIAQGVEKERLESIKNIMRSFKVTAEKAMESLGIPEGEYEKYLSKL